jgi:hypothetical protein
MPPSFCALVQRAGRAARDFTVLGEAILIVPASLISKGVSDVEVESTLSNNADNESTEAENRSDEAAELLASNGIQLAQGNKMVHVDDGGVRVAQDSDDEGDGAHSAQIYELNTENTVTLYPLSRPSGCPADCTQWTM